MSERSCAGSATTRRRFLTTLASATAISAADGLAAPAFSRLSQRPTITHGVQSGDVSLDSGMVWARADRPARMLIEAATTDGFKDIVYASFADALPETDFTAKALIEDLPAGQDIFYRLRLQDLSSPAAVGEPVIGRFRTAPSDRRSISFVWSGDTAGQGWGIDVSRGGMRTYTTMLHNRPDFFIHCGDSIYADCTVSAEQKLPNGATWRNIVTEEKSKVATTLADYRGNYKYNLLDTNVRAFNAEVPIFAQWDNHEVMEEWWPGEEIDRRGYDVKSALLLAARGCRAFHEFMPLRYARGGARPNLPENFLRSVARCVPARYAQLPRPKRGESAKPIRPWRLPARSSAACLDQARTQAFVSNLESDRIGYPARNDCRHHARRPDAARTRHRDRRLVVVHATRRHSQHTVAHRRPALHRRALFRSEQCSLPGLRTILGIRFRPDPCRHLDTFGPRSGIRPAYRLSKRCEPGAGR